MEKKDKKSKKTSTKKKLSKTSPNIPAPEENANDFWDSLIQGDLDHLKKDTSNIHNLYLESNVIRDALSRPLTPAEFYYFLSKFPYLSIVDFDSPQKNATKKARLLKLGNGWTIHDWGNQLTSSYIEIFDSKHPPAIWTSFDGAQFPENSTHENYFQGHGTIVQQFFDTAFEMIHLASQRWATTHIIEGFYSMKRAAWIAAEMHEHKLEGFEPSHEDQVVSSWVHLFSSKRLKQKIAPTKLYK